MAQLSKETQPKETILPARMQQTIITKSIRQENGIILHDSVSTLNSNESFGSTFSVNRRGPVNRVKSIGEIRARQAGCALWEREMRIRKEAFGLELFSLMERNYNMGKEGGGETEKSVVAVFLNCLEEIVAITKKRNILQLHITKNTPKKTLSMRMQIPKDRLSNDDSFASLSSTESTAGPTNWFQKRMKQAQDAVNRNQQNGQMRKDIDHLEKQITERKKKFGIAMFEVMVFMIDNYVPSDPQIRELLVAARKDVQGPLDRTIQAEREIHEIRTVGEVLVSYQEIRHFVEKTPSSWAMLQVNLGIPEDECKNVAYHVCLELSSGLPSQEAANKKITKRQFERFKKNYIDDPKGSQEFFHRTVFGAFDNNQNGVLDKEETDKFLDTFYVTGSIFQGDHRLPEKEVLKELIWKQLDENGDGEFTFDEIRSLISGSAARGDLTGL